MDETMDIRREAEDSLNQSIESFFGELLQPKSTEAPEMGEADATTFVRNLVDQTLLASAPSAPETTTETQAEAEDTASAEDTLESLITRWLLADEETEESTGEATEEPATLEAEASEESEETEAPAKTHKKAKTEAPQKAVARDDDEEEEESDDEETYDEDEEDDDWLSQLFKKEPSKSKASKEKTKEAKVATSTDEIAELKKQVETLTQLAQFVTAAVQLEQWVDSTAKEALKVQEELARYGIQLSDDEIISAMQKAAEKALTDPKAFQKTIRPVVVKKIATLTGKMRQLPVQPQAAQVNTPFWSPSMPQSQPTHRDILNSFEDIVRSTLEEIKARG